MLRGTTAILYSARLVRRCRDTRADACHRTASHSVRARVNRGRGRQLLPGMCWVATAQDAACDDRLDQPPFGCAACKLRSRVCRWTFD